MELENSQNNSLAKLPILKLGEYEMWEIRIKQYFQIARLCIMEVIRKWKLMYLFRYSTRIRSLTSDKDDCARYYRRKEVCKKNDVKARSLLSWLSQMNNQTNLHPRIIFNTASAETSTAILVMPQAYALLCPLHHKDLNLYMTEVKIVGKIGVRYEDRIEAVLMKTGLKTVKNAKPLSTVRSVNTARPVSTARARGFNAVKPSAMLGLIKFPNSMKKGFVDSGCSRHMSGNIAHLSDFKEFDGGYVTFGGGANGGRITGKGTIKTNNLDFEDVYFVKELKFNLFSVSQMCDKKNYVLFTDSECLVLSPNFKLPDESQVLLKIPRQNNISTVSVKYKEVSESSTPYQQDQDCIIMPIWKDASYFEDSSLKSVADAQIQDQDVAHDDCRFQDDGFDENQVNTASPQVNTGSGEISTATPEVNTATSEG
ncbi:hypothetical protein Tco_0794957 [Tanacetum coccineum]